MIVVSCNVTGFCMDWWSTHCPVEYCIVGLATALGATLPTLGDQCVDYFMFIHVFEWACEVGKANGLTSVPNDAVI